MIIITLLTAAYYFLVFLLSPSIQIPQHCCHFQSTNNSPDTPKIISKDHTHLEKLATPVSGAWLDLATPVPRVRIAPVHFSPVKEPALGAKKTANMEKCVVCVAAVLIFLSSLCSLSLSWSDCGSTGMNISSVSMRDCPNDSDTCWAKKNQNDSLYIVFTPLHNYTNLTVTVNASVGVYNEKFPLFDGGYVCTSGVSCPLVAGATQKARLSFMLDPSIPNFFKIQTKWEFRDGGGTERGCVEVTFMILKEKND